jgi:hypothetical protein
MSNTSLDGTRHLATLECGGLAPLSDTALRVALGAGEDGSKKSWRNRSTWTIWLSLGVLFLVLQ